MFNGYVHLQGCSATKVFKIIQSYNRAMNTEMMHGVVHAVPAFPEIDAVSDTRL